ncbi:kekkon 3 [Carabus blaptoides fortunei]
MTMLQVLNLSFNSISRLETGTFDNNKALLQLYLQFNAIAILPQGLFKNLEKLITISLGHNRISSIGKNVFPENLQQVFLQNNQLKYLDASFLKLGDRLTSLDLYDNPWHCDCRLQAFFNVTKKFHKHVRCYKPKGLEPWTNLTNDDFQCEIKPGKSCMRDAKKFSYTINASNIFCKDDNDGRFITNGHRYKLKVIDTRLEFEYIDAVEIDSERQCLEGVLIAVEAVLLVILFIVTYFLVKKFKQRANAISQNGSRKTTNIYTEPELPASRVSSSTLPNLVLAAPYGNPWSCDCRMKKLKSVIRFLFPQPTCMEPENLRDTNWHILKPNALSCWLHIILQQTVTNITVHDDSVVLSCITEAFPEPNIKWMHLNKILDLDNATHKYHLSRSYLNHTMYYYNLTILNVSSTDKGLYTCKLNNTEQEVEKRFNLTIKPAKLPVILAPTDSTITADVETNNFTLACKVSSIPRPNIKWIYLGVDSDTEQTIMINSVGIESDSYWANLTISQLSPKYNGKYWCMASNSKGQVTKLILLKTRSYLSNWLIFFMILGCGFIIFLTLVFIMKCFIRFYATQNETKDGITCPPNQSAPQ